MPLPLIGLTTSRFNSSAGIPMVGTTEPYVQSVLAAGGIPILIPTGLALDQVTALADVLNGIIFTGGGDISISRYNGRPHERVSEVDELRDELEINLAQLAAGSAKPFLGICRGAQVVNVALGGSLYSDIADHFGKSVRHDYYPIMRRDYLAHPVGLQPGSRLAQIMGSEQVEVNSLHHQAVQDVARGLTASGRSPDGLVEGLELEGHPFGIAVQWHPEWLQAHQPMRDLFKAFVAAAGSQPARKRKDR